MADGAAERRVRLSVVVPAHNEMSRLPIYLQRIRAYCQVALAGQYEVVVVDDGSDDGTGEYVERLAADWDALSAIRLPENLGKGAAVRTGMLAGAGGLLLFTDADGATPIDQEEKLRLAIEDGADVAIGSRIDRTAHSRRRWTRALAGWAFRRAVQWQLALPVEDTQCGFKMFRRDVGRRLFSACDEDGYLVDLFVLRLAVRFGYTVKEVPVEWHEMGGSRVRLVRDSWAMWRGLRRLEQSVDSAINSIGAEVDC